MQMTVYQRVATYLKSKKISQELAGERYGVTKKTISNWVLEKKPMPLSFLIWIKQEYPMLNLDWIFTGEGEMELKVKTELEVRIDTIELELRKLIGNVKQIGEK